MSPARASSRAPAALTRRRLLKIGSLAAVGATAGSGRWVRVSNELEVTRTALSLAGPGPPLVIALLADLHAPQPGFDFAAMSAAANAARPDLVLIVGDAINRRGHEGLVEAYGSLEARYGKYAVAGNWENWGRVDRGDLAMHYRRAGCALLDNAVTDLDELGVRLVGLDESTNGRPDEALVGQASGSTLTVLMHHSPGAFDRLPLPAAPMLMVSGHTHGGQLAPLGRPIFLPAGSGRYARGLYRRGPHGLYVSRGLGNSHVPLRIGARPELAILGVARAL